MVVFAGPNGAGKSTHAEAILEGLGIDTFVNADYIARGLTGPHPDRVAFEAGRIMLRRLHQLAQSGQDFGFESTLATRSFARFLSGLRERGYEVSVYYFALASPKLAVRRVRLRVALGGHDVAPDVVRRRYLRSLANFMTLYRPRADQWAVFDNSRGPKAKLVAAYDGEQLFVKQQGTWEQLLTRAASSSSSSR